MTHFINRPLVRPLFWTAPLALIASVASVGSATPAAARGLEEVRIAVPTGHVAETSRRIRAAASAACDSGGVASLYREGARRCRQRAIAEAERRLRGG